MLDLVIIVLDYIIPIAKNDVVKVTRKGQIRHKNDDVFDPPLPLLF